MFLSYPSLVNFSSLVAVPSFFLDAKRSDVENKKSVNSCADLLWIPALEWGLHGPFLDWVFFQFEMKGGSWCFFWRKSCGECFWWYLDFFCLLLILEVPSLTSLLETPITKIEKQLNRFPHAYYQGESRHSLSLSSIYFIWEYLLSSKLCESQRLLRCHL